MFLKEISKNMPGDLTIMAMSNHDQDCIRKQQYIDPETVLDIKIKQTGTGCSERPTNKSIDHSSIQMPAW